MHTSKTKDFSFFKRIRSRWSPLTFIIALSLFMITAIVIGTLMDRYSSSSANNSNHSPAHSNVNSATSSTAQAKTSASGASTSSLAASAHSGSSATVIQSAAPSAKPQSSSQPGSAQNVDIIKTADLTIQAAHPSTSMTHVRQLITAQGGYVQALQTQKQQNATSVQLTARIPSTHFNTFLDKLKTLGTVTNFEQSGRNVTQQSNNLQVQLHQLESESAAYSRLYRKAKTMKDMLQIQQSLSEVNSEISNVKQQIHHLSQSVQFGTIAVHIKPKTSITVAHEKPVWGPLGQSLHFMKQSAFGLVTFLAWVLPWSILVGIGVWGWTKWKRRHSSANKSM